MHLKFFTTILLKLIKNKIKAQLTADRFRSRKRTGSREVILALRQAILSGH